jgi:hypothetical protein
MSDKNPWRSILERSGSFTHPSHNEGMVEPGNIDIFNRPRVKNPDGSVSTVRSMGVNVDGHEVLLPTVSEQATILSPREAIEQYRQTGRHLGKFANTDASDAYAQKLHLQQEAMLEQYPQAHQEMVPPYMDLLKDKK